jgi:hypothetical protein
MNVFLLDSEPETPHRRWRTCEVLKTNGWVVTEHAKMPSPEPNLDAWDFVIAHVRDVTTATAWDRLASHRAGAILFVGGQNAPPRRDVPCILGFDPDNPGFVEGCRIVLEERHLTQRALDAFLGTSEVLEAALGVFFASLASGASAPALDAPAAGKTVGECVALLSRTILAKSEGKCDFALPTDAVPAARAAALRISLRDYLGEPC